jgi:hypothetical protein
MSKSLEQFWKVIAETDPPKLQSLPIQKIKSYEHYLSTKLPSLTDEQLVTVCRNRIDLLRQEIQSQRIAENYAANIAQMVRPERAKQIGAWVADCIYVT